MASIGFPVCLGDMCQGQSRSLRPAVGQQAAVGGWSVVSGCGQQAAGSGRSTVAASMQRAAVCGWSGVGQRSVVAANSQRSAVGQQAGASKQRAAFGQW